jgi:hypothetical protein
MESIAARHLCLQRGLKGGNEALQLVHSHPDETQERRRAGLQARARSISQRGGLLASEASEAINRDKLKYFEDDVIGICAGLWNLVLSY